MKTVEEHYQDWYNNRIGGDMDLHIDFVDKDACDFAKYYAKQLSIHNVVKSLPIQDLPNCTRVEVIDQKGRSYVNWKSNNKVRLSMQDDGRTVKIFID